jgi:hypothetical protein
MQLSEFGDLFLSSPNLRCGESVGVTSLEELRDATLFLSNRARDVTLISQSSSLSRSSFFHFLVLLPFFPNMASSLKQPDGMTKTDTIGTVDEPNKLQGYASAPGVFDEVTRVVDHKAERRLCRKFDYRLLPILAIMCKLGVP